MTLLPLVAAGLVLSAAIGVATSGSAPLAIAAAWAVAIVATVITLGFSVGPPGSMFFVLVAGVSAHITSDGVDGLLLIGMVALGSAIAYLVVLAPLIVPSVRRSQAHAPMRGFAFDATTRVIAARVAIGVSAAALIAAPLGIPRAYWVIVAVVVILQNGHRLRLTAIRAVHRVAGTVIGVGLFALIALWHPSGLALALVLTALQFTVEMFVVRNYGLALIFITPLALTIAAQGAQTTDVALERVLDTILGAAIALAVLGASWGLRRVRPART
jgi:hypothetical protein